MLLCLSALVLRNLGAVFLLSTDNEFIAVKVAGNFKTVEEQRQESMSRFSRGCGSGSRSEE